MPILREAFAELPGSLWKLSVSLPMGRSTGRVENSTQRFPKGRVVESSYWN